VRGRVVVHRASTALIDDPAALEEALTLHERARARDLPPAPRLRSGHSEHAEG
jgi:hypothetical protein